MTKEEIRRKCEEVLGNDRPVSFTNANDTAVFGYPSRSERVTAPVVDGDSPAEAAPACCYTGRQALRDRLVYLYERSVCRADGLRRLLEVLDAEPEDSPMVSLLAPLLDRLLAPLLDRLR